MLLFQLTSKHVFYISHDIASHFRTHWDCPNEEFVPPLVHVDGVIFFVFLQTWSWLRGGARMPYGVHDAIRLVSWHSRLSYSGPFAPNICCSVVTTAPPGATEMRCGTRNKNLFSSPCLFFFSSFALCEKDLDYSLDPQQEVEPAVCHLPPATCGMHMPPAACFLPLVAHRLLHLSTNHHISFFTILSRDNNLCPVPVYL